MSDPPPYNDDTDSIFDDDELLRRIHPNWVVPDPKQPRGFRLSTQAFENDRRNGTPCSVSVRRCALPVEELLVKYSDRSLAGISVAFVRQHEQGVCFWEDQDEPGHAYLHGQKSRTVLSAIVTEARCIGGQLCW